MWVWDNFLFFFWMEDIDGYGIIWPQELPQSLKTPIPPAPGPRGRMPFMHTLLFVLFVVLVFLLDEIIFLIPSIWPVMMLEIFYLNFPWDKSDWTLSCTWFTGFAGYFDATLYKDVHLGIEPSTATPNMFSWYDIWFSFNLFARNFSFEA